MTKDEFIDHYLKNVSPGFGRPRFSRTANGIETAGDRRVAMPCACGETGCDGWAMVPDDPEQIEMHNRLYGPSPPA